MVTLIITVMGIAFFFAVCALGLLLGAKAAHKDIYGDDGIEPRRK